MKQMKMNNLRHITVILLLAVAWLGATAGGTGRLKNYDIWKDLPSKQLRDMGRRYFDNSNIDSALVCYNILANRYYTTPKSDKEELKWIGSAMNQLGIIYTYFFVDYEKANRYLLQAKKIAEQNGNKKLRAATSINLRNIRIVDDTFLGDGTISDSTINLHHYAFEASLEANDPESVLISAAGLAHMTASSPKREVMLDDIKQFLNYQMPDSIKNHEWVYDYCKAAIEINNDNSDAALALYDKALAHVFHQDKRNQEILKIGILNDKCRLLLNMHRYSEMLAILQDFAQQGETTGDHQLQYLAYQAIGEYYHDIAKDSITGDRYELLALREKDITLSKNKLLDADKTEFLFQIDEINAEVQELTARQLMTKMIAWGTAVFTLIILGLLYWLWRKYKQEQENHRKLYENNLALLAVDDERRRLLLEYAAKLDEEPTKYQSHQMEEGESSDLLHRIFYIIETSDEVYQDTFSLDRLTELVEARSSKYVSQVLNDYYHQSFPTVVNEHRIREACRRINDHEHYGTLTNEGIARSVGFNSYPNFVTNFKKFTGLTPSAYRKQGKEIPSTPTPEDSQAPLAP